VSAHGGREREQQRSAPVACEGTPRWESGPRRIDGHQDLVPARELDFDRVLPGCGVDVREGAATRRAQALAADKQRRRGEHAEIRAAYHRRTVLSDKF
jgi:hypothetical protein